MRIARRLLVRGFVQGVGYRYFACRKAIEYGITGFVRNLYNGDVEIEAEGQEGMMKEYIKELHIGPRNSDVRSVIEEEIEFENKYADFSVFPNA